MASALNVAVILKQKLHHFINCNTSNGVQHGNNDYEQPKCCCHNSFQAFKSDVDMGRAIFSMTEIANKGLRGMVHRTKISAKYTLV